MKKIDLLCGQNWADQLLTNHREHPFGLYAGYSIERLCDLTTYNIVSYAQVYERTPQGFERWAARNVMFKDMLLRGACDLIR